MGQTITCRAPTLQDGADMWRIAQAAGVDPNSPYKYLVFCRDFAETSVIARAGDEAAGFVTGYRRPQAPDTLFVWQIAVLETFRGAGVAGSMLAHLVDSLAPRGIAYVEATVTPGNTASARLFDGLATRRGVPCRREPLFDASLFPVGHDAEILFRIGPLGSFRAPAGAPGSSA
jgi:L-2,4-diaminobutyric acid acetyltransferase